MPMLIYADIKDDFLDLAMSLRIHRIEAINFDKFRWSGMQRFMHS